MGLGIRVSPKGCLPTALPCRAKGKQAAQRGFQGRGNNWDTSISRKTSFELVTPCHLCKTRKGGRLETLPRVITKPSTPTQSHAEVWIPRGSQKGPTPTGADDLCNPQSCSGFPTHPFIVILRGFHSPAGPSRHMSPKNHSLPSRASRSRKPSTASQHSR